MANGFALDYHSRMTAEASPGTESSADLDRVARRRGIVLLLQFGSSVTGRMHERSDLDLGALLERAPRSLGEHADLLHDLQEMFPEREVDLAILNRADPLFLKKITDACRLLYGSSRDLHRFKIYAFKRYQDHRRYLEMERRYVARSLAGRSAK
ncbi:MAG: type VII toxin-antitoxin system MntA family adenylyltransferase antitoxin [Candidatus Binatia bacterium]